MTSPTGPRSPSTPPAVGGGDDEPATILLTGATGFLGRFLLRDLSAAGHRVAVLVRGDGRRSAEERTDALLDDWEVRAGVRPATPVVLAGDLREDGLGLDEDARDFVRERVDLVLHCAASLSFTPSADGEPARTNVGGTRALLQLCRETGVRDFHHVSTAYVAGTATGRVFEGPADESVPPGNPYERSKRDAERLVRAAGGADGFLAPPTFYRPAIIVGDSATGFTTTFHGFYAVLRVCQLVADAVRDGRSDDVGRRRITLAGHELKHLVPVEWVSAAITRLVGDRRTHGRTYHLTPDAPVTVETMRRVLGETTGLDGVRFVGPDFHLDEPSLFERTFYDGIHVYNSYWRDDPVFDRTHTAAALPDLPCPPISQETLAKLARFAVAARFRHRDGRVVRPAQVAETRTVENRTVENRTVETRTVETRTARTGGLPAAAVSR